MPASAGMPTIAIAIVSATAVGTPAIAETLATAGMSPNVGTPAVAVTRATATEKRCSLKHIKKA